MKSQTKYYTHTHTYNDAVEIPQVFSHLQDILEYTKTCTAAPVYYILTVVPEFSSIKEICPTTVLLLDIEVDSSAWQLQLGRKGHLLG